MRIGIIAHAHHADILKLSNELQIPSWYNSYLIFCCSMNALPQMILCLYIAESGGQIPIDISVENYEFRADGLSIKCECVLRYFGMYS